MHSRVSNFGRDNKVFGDMSWAGGTNAVGRMEDDGSVVLNCNAGGKKSAPFYSMGSETLAIKAPGKLPTASQQLAPGATGVYFQLVGGGDNPGKQCVMAVLHDSSSIKKKKEETSSASPDPVGTWSYFPGDPGSWSLLDPNGSPPSNISAALDVLAAKLSSSSSSSSSSQQQRQLVAAPSSSLPVLKKYYTMRAQRTAVAPPPAQVAASSSSTTGDYYFPATAPCGTGEKRIYDFKTTVSARGTFEVTLLRVPTSLKYTAVKVSDATVVLRKEDAVAVANLSSPGIWTTASAGGLMQHLAPVLEPASLAALVLCMVGRSKLILKGSLLPQYQTKDPLLTLEGYAEVVFI